MNKIKRLFNKSRKIISKRKFFRKNIFSCIFIPVVFVLVLIIINVFIIPQIKLEGDKKVLINYKTKYIDKGYKAYYLGKDISNDVYVSGKVNDKKLGTYELKYKVGNGLFSKEVTRKVVVVDKEKPKLEIDNSSVYICPGDEVVPQKVKAFDNYDGDISKKVKNIISKEKDSITYMVTDSSNNTLKITKKIIYKDKEKPNIEFNGNETEYSFVGDEFKDPSIIVSDNCDDAIGKKIKTDSNVDISKAGEYQITYTVTDKYNNTNSITRKVIISERGRDGTIYLTFDDGPNSGTTNVILDILKEEGVSATFFVTNKGPDELIKREYDEGHTVALHTASHDYATVYSSVDNYFNDLQAVHDRVERITGYDSRIIRFPGGSSNTISRRYSAGIMSTLTKEVINRGYKYYDWNLSSGDAAGGSPSHETIYNNVVNNLRHDRVNMVLMHDIKPYTRDALRDIIRYGKENGYTFEKITMSTEMITQRVNN